MNRLCIETRGICSWRERLASPGSQWRRTFSAFETAVSWERASRTTAGLPGPILDLFRDTVLCEPTLEIAIAEHKVQLPGGKADSQCDVWALLNTKAGRVSLSVEAKAKEPFGQGNESLKDWLDANPSKKSQGNRQERWECIQKNLPRALVESYSEVAYQLLHRCAAAVIEAERCNAPNAAFIVQAFRAPIESFNEFAKFCAAFGAKAESGRMQMVSVGAVRLGVGWAECPLATDEDIAAIV
jgi:Domain of unknown function (DUF6946)/FAD-NAD(P)-binding